MRDTVPVFLSIGRHYGRDEDAFLHLVSMELARLGLYLERLPRDRWSFDTPLLAIQEVMGRCHGVLVVAFPRLHYPEGIEWPGTPEARPIGERDAATIWLQIEAALAFQMDLPLLIFVDDRLHPEGLLNPRHHEYGALLYQMENCQDSLPTSLVDALRGF